MLFADIRDFTTLSEAISPEQVVELLNDYFSEMVDARLRAGRRARQVHRRRHARRLRLRSTSSPTTAAGPSLPACA